MREDGLKKITDKVVVNKSAINSSIEDIRDIVFEETLSLVVKVEYTAHLWERSGFNPQVGLYIVEHLQDQGLKSADKSFLKLFFIPWYVKVVLPGPIHKKFKQVVSYLNCDEVYQEYISLYGKVIKDFKFVQDFNFIDSSWGYADRRIIGASLSLNNKKKCSFSFILSNVLLPSQPFPAPLLLDTAEYPLQNLLHMEEIIYKFLDNIERHLRVQT